MSATTDHTGTKSRRARRSRSRPAARVKHRFHNLGGMPFLIWKLIEEGKASGTERIDFGRSDLDNQGLIAFKDRLGATGRLLTYYRYTNLKGSNARNTGSRKASGVCPFWLTELCLWLEGSCTGTLASLPPPQFLT